MKDLTVYCLDEGKYKRILDVSNRNIHTAVIGLTIAGVEDVNIKDNRIVRNILPQLKQTATSDCLFLEMQKEYLIISLNDNDSINNKIMQGLNIWVQRYKALYKDIYIDIGIDKRVIQKISCIKDSITMARYRMYKSHLKGIPEECLNENNIRYYIDTFKTILNNTVKTQCMYDEDNEMYQISAFLDGLINEYIRKFGVLNS